MPKFPSGSTPAFSTLKLGVEELSLPSASTHRGPDRPRPLQLASLGQGLPGSPQAPDFLEPGREGLEMGEAWSPTEATAVLPTHTGGGGQRGIPSGKSGQELSDTKAPAEGSRTKL